MYLLPTLCGLTLKQPKGSRREVIYFIGLFQHLQDLKLLYDRTNDPEEPVGDLELVPSSIPPLRGLLTVRGTRRGLLEDIIDLFGGFRFHHINFFEVDAMGLLLEAGAKTLESVMLHPSDFFSKQLPQNDTQVFADYCTVRPSLRDFLSRNESLQTLKIPAPPADDPHFDVLLEHILSSITSPSFSEVVVLYRDRDFPSAESWSSGQPPFRHEPAQTESASEVAGRRRPFKVLRKMQKVRPFQLVLCASVWGCVRAFGVVCERLGLCGGAPGANTGRCCGRGESERVVR